MVSNDAAAIGRFMSDDWTIIGSDGGIIDKATFLGLVSSGTVTHDVMESDDFHVRVYGDAAVVTSRGVSGGTYQGRRFREVERVTCVFVRQQGAMDLCRDTPLPDPPDIVDTRPHPVTRFERLSPSTRLCCTPSNVLPSACC